MRKRHKNVVKKFIYWYIEGLYGYGFEAGMSFIFLITWGVLWFILSKIFVRWYPEAPTFFIIAVPVAMIFNMLAFRKRIRSFLDKVKKEERISRWHYDKGEPHWK